MHLHSSPIGITTLIPGIAVVAILVALTALRRSKRKRAGGLEVPWPLERKPSLLTEPEKILYRRLVQALPHHIVLAQVQLLQMMRFRPRAPPYAVLNRMNRLSVDFVVLTSDTGIVAAIELDDASHLRSDRQSADTRKAHALASAGIPLIRWSVRTMPDVNAISAAIESASLPAVTVRGL